MKKDGGGKEPVDTKPKMDEAKLTELKQKIGLKEQIHKPRKRVI